MQCCRNGVCIRRRSPRAKNNGEEEGGQRKRSGRSEVDDFQGSPRTIRDISGKGKGIGGAWNGQGFSVRVIRKGSCLRHWASCSVFYVTGHRVPSFFSHRVPVASCSVFYVTWAVFYVTGHRVPSFTSLARGFRHWASCSVFYVTGHRVSSFTSPGIVFRLFFTSLGIVFRLLRHWASCSVFCVTGHRVPSFTSLGIVFRLLRHRASCSVFLRHWASCSVFYVTGHRVPSFFRVPSFRHWHRVPSFTSPGIVFRFSSHRVPSLRHWASCSVFCVTGHPSFASLGIVFRLLRHWDRVPSFTSPGIVSVFLRHWASCSVFYVTGHRVPSFTSPGIVFRLLRHWASCSVFCVTGHRVPSFTSRHRVPSFTSPGIVFRFTSLASCSVFCGHRVPFLRHWASCSVFLRHWASCSVFCVTGHMRHGHRSVRYVTIVFRLLRRIVVPSFTSLVFRLLRHWASCSVFFTSLGIVFRPSLRAGIESGAGY
ncbi:hypothetical protein C7M84_005329 [Penaeus vannamei]|uniref:Uncharacterized protein n=1 Tax=Penaeus vannamei TaxID=6689 RepID=A0A3R7SUT0_PENVA|nr:hypothetical protein C7M84_005329 [Penaeus vannamei]